MSNVKFIERLLDGAEVEWKQLGDLADNLDSQRKPITSGLRVPGEVPYYGASGVVDYVKDYIFDGDFLLVSEDGANLVARKTPIAFSISGKSWVNNHAHILKFNTYTERRYIEIYLNSIDLTPYISGAAQPKLNKKNLNSIDIPIPCPDDPEKSLAIQAEIVRILDTFTELTTELTTELNARKKQYNYYRDQLFSFEEGEVEWKTLGWVGHVRMCKRIMKNQTSDSGDIPFFKIGTFGKEPNSYISRDIYEEYRDRYNYPRVGEVLISASGTIGRAVIFDGKDAYFQDSNIVWLENDESKVLNKYLFYFYQIANWHVSDGGVIKRLYNDNIKKTPILIPYPDDAEKSLAEQARVVAILDKFDTLANSISKGLPREIELRQKQYEYYRDLLLSFPKPEVTEGV